MENKGSMIVVLYILCYLLLSSLSICGVQFEPPVPTWKKVKRSDSNQGFAARNGFGLCVFKDSLWVVGGRSEEYITYNLIPSVRRSDVWKRCMYTLTCVFTCAVPCHEVTNIILSRLVICLRMMTPVTITVLHGNSRL